MTTTAALIKRETPEVRDLRFNLSDVPRFWHGERRAVTLFFDNLSIFFPAGERFFMASVKAFRNQVTDPQLKSEVDAFCAQEGHHSREHVRYNKMIAAKGYPVDAMERRVEWILQRVTKYAPRKRQLAVTCALEHFTAMLASLVLKDPKMLENAEPRMAELWRWHSAEETEHKAVAFDVYRAIGGSWLMRCIVMFLTTLVFWGKVYEHQVRLMHEEKILFSVTEWFSLVRYLFIQPGGMLGLVGPYLDYYRPGFHPWEHDNSEMLQQWKAGLTAPQPARLQG
ncbi:metal-dependent hydrolase [Vitiosangium sp. GDMCC 1.1324]|uniref:metal-dependent hydrolase n=1 Tax=Vitiosangium sp. (strain GDMCC 1.1324) TaxID=2138576 RepID=UPI00130DC998|nr:metal-dependent hydrolase [Vitiosangium sp. GDMCC 1.1324]